MGYSITRRQGGGALLLPLLLPPAVKDNHRYAKIPWTRGQLGKLPTVSKQVESSSRKTISYLWYKRKRVSQPEQCTDIRHLNSVGPKSDTEFKDLNSSKPKLDTEFLNSILVEPEPKYNFVFKMNIRQNTKFSGVTYFNFRNLCKDTNVRKGKSLVKFRWWSNFSCLFQFRFN